MEESLNRIFAGMADRDVAEYIVSVCMSDIRMDFDTLVEAVSPFLLSSEFVDSDAKCNEIAKKVFKG